MDRLKVHRFDGAGYKWLKYVLANHKNIELNDDSDIVVGAVANDRTMPVIVCILRASMMRRKP